VDIYGDCGEKKCPKDNYECFKGIEKNYKFYLSFENSFCVEYITEKFWQILGESSFPLEIVVYDVFIQMISFF
jgi:hypothetical protein